MIADTTYRGRPSAGEVTLWTQPLPIALLLILSLALAACGGDNSPSDPFNVGIARTVTMEPFARSVSEGGEMTSVSLGVGEEIVGVLDGELVRIPRGEGPVVIDGSREYVWGSVFPGGGIVGVTADAIVSYPAGASSAATTQFEPVGPGEAILSVSGSSSIDGRVGVISVASSEPRTRAWITTNGGESWGGLEFSGGEESMRLRGDVVIMPDGVIVAGNADGLFASTDNGVSWSTRTELMPNRAVALMAASDGSIYRYSPGDGGLAVSNDGGQNFIDVWFNALPPFFVEVRELVGGELIALGNQTKIGGVLPLSRPMSLYHSSDGGRTWNEIMPVSAHALATRNTTIALALTGSPISGAPQPGGIAVSFDRGLLWEKGASGGSPSEIVDFSFAGEGDLLILSNGGMYQNSSLRLNFLGAPFDPHWIAGGADGAVYWQTERGTFRKGTGGSVEEIETDGWPFPLRDGSVLFVGDEGIDRYSVSAGFERISDEAREFERIVEEKGGVLAGISGGTILRSTDGGATWSASTDAVGITCNSEGGCILQKDGDWHLLSGDGTTLSPLEFIGLPVSTDQISRITWDRRDRLWVLLTDGRLYASDTIVL